MSFSSNLKMEIIEQTIKASCCRKAFASALIASKAVVREGLVSINLENDAHAFFAAKFIAEFFGASPTPKRPKAGGRCRVLEFASKSAIRYVNSINSTESLYNAKCPTCEAAFFKGLFFAAGRISDPAKQYLLEFSPTNCCEKFLRSLSDIGVEARTTQRNGRTDIYIKKSSIIEDFFAFIGLNSAAFAFMNAKIESEFRNNTNRIVNCETNNISKSVTASHKQISVIDELERHNLLSSLPEELEATARLRIKYRDLSLSQLAAVAVPAISKSGLSHRLKKIMEYSETLLPSVKK